MASKAFKYELVATKESGVASDVEGFEITVTNVTALHVRPELGFDEKFAYTPTVQIFRLINVSQACDTDEECVPFAETCEMVYLPPGRYFVTMCSIENVSAYADMDEAELKVTIITEEMTEAYKQAMELNNLRSC